MNTTNMMFHKNDQKPDNHTDCAIVPHVLPHFKMGQNHVISCQMDYADYQIFRTLARRQERTPTSQARQLIKIAIRT